MAYAVMIRRGTLTGEPEYMIDGDGWPSRFDDRDIAEAMVAAFGCYPNAQVVRYPRESAIDGYAAGLIVAGIALALLAAFSAFVKSGWAAANWPL